MFGEIHCKEKSSVIFGVRQLVLRRFSFLLFELRWKKNFRTSSRNEPCSWRQGALAIRISSVNAAYRYLRLKTLHPQLPQLSKPRCPYPCPRNGARRRPNRTRHIKQGSRHAWCLAESASLRDGFACERRVIIANARARYRDVAGGAAGALVLGGGASRRADCCCCCCGWAGCGVCWY